MGISLIMKSMYRAKVRQYKSTFNKVTILGGPELEHENWLDERHLATIKKGLLVGIAKLL